MESPCECGIEPPGSIAVELVNVFLPYARLITVVSIYFDLQLRHLVPNIYFCFSNHQGAVFFLQLLSLPSSGRSRRRWEDNIRMDIKEIGVSTRNWINSVQNWDYWRVLVHVTMVS